MEEERNTNLFAGKHGDQEKTLAARFLRGPDDVISKPLLEEHEPLIALFHVVIGRVGNGRISRGRERVDKGLPAAEPRRVVGLEGVDDLFDLVLPVQVGGHHLHVAEELGARLVGRRVPVLADRGGLNGRIQVGRQLVYPRGVDGLAGILGHREQVAGNNELARKGRVSPCQIDLRVGQEPGLAKRLQRVRRARMVADGVKVLALEHDALVARGAKRRPQGVDPLPGRGDAHAASRVGADGHVDPVVSRRGGAGAGRRDARVLVAVAPWVECVAVGTLEEFLLGNQH